MAKGGIYGNFENKEEFAWRPLIICRSLAIIRILTIKCAGTRSGYLILAFLVGLAFFLFTKASITVKGIKKWQVTQLSNKP